MKKTLITLSLATSLFVGNAMAGTEQQDALAVVARAAPASVFSTPELGVFASATTVFAGYGVNVLGFESYEAAEKFAALSNVDVRAIIDTNKTYVVRLSGNSASVKGTKKSMSLASAVQLYGELGVLYVGFVGKSEAEKFCIAAGVSKTFIIKTANGVWTVRISGVLPA
jgi:hypothetical protein